MVQVIRTEDPRSKIPEMLGMSLGQGIGNGLNTYFANRSLDSVLQDKALENAPLSKKWEAMRSALSPYGERGQEILQQRLMIDQQEMQEREVQKQEKLQRIKGRAIDKFQRGEPLSEEEWARFTPQEVAALQNVEIQSRKVAAKEREAAIKEREFENQQRAAARTEESQRQRGRSIAKYQKGEELSDEEWAAFTPSEVAALQKAYHPAPAGGITAQPTPPKYANIIQEVLKDNVKADADQLRLQMDLRGVPSIFSNPYIENRRQQGIQNVEQFKGEREFHTKRAYPVVQEAEAIIQAHPIKKGLLDQQRRDIATGNVEGFPQFMSDKLGLEIYRNPEASRFKNISKNRFIESLSELGGAGARPNQFIEQQLTQAQPAIGRSALANQTVLDLEEFIEDMKLQRAKYVEQLAADDFEKYGYERGDLNARANKLMESYADKRQDEMAYDIRRRTEEEMDNETLTREIVGKNVPKDTPLTVRVARILMIKNNDDERKAFEEAKRLGFKIPLESTYQRGSQ